MTVRVAVDVPGLELGAYQKTVRTLLRHPLVTPVYPDDRTLRAVRRWSATLQADLLEVFGYRLELRGHTARLVKVHDGLDPDRPAELKNERVLDRRRYAYLALALAVLGRAGLQTTLGELADAVSADAARIPGLGLDPDNLHDRRAFVDAMTWLEERGAVRLTDGSASSWASDPDRSEALYDVARDVVQAVYRPGRVLQHIGSVTALLDRPTGTSENARRRAAGQRARRLLVEAPVVYLADTEPAVANHLRSPALAEDLERLTGLRVERRAEGVLLVDTADTRFPGTGTVTQVALLLLGAMADRFVDPDARRLPRVSPPTAAERQARLIALVDSGLPRAGVLNEVAGLDLTDLDPASVDPASVDEMGPASVDEVGPASVDETEPAGDLPFISDNFLRRTMKEIIERYGSAFAREWREDPDRLRAAALAVLARYRFVAPVDGGVALLPLAGRYRNVDVKLRARRADGTLFDLKEKR